MTVRLSVLDISPIVEGSNPRQALHNTVDLAILADSLGYHRYWVPEHHSMRGVASSAPAVLIGHLASATRRLRIGAGGVLLPNHSPIVVAEQFATLAALHPGRIDLGIGRAPGGPLPAVEAVRPERERTAKTFRQQCDELVAYLNPSSDSRITAVPALGGNTPPIWLLGSSTSSAKLAAELGLPYAFAHHLNPDSAVAALRIYRQATTLVSVSVIAADTDDDAEYLAGPTRLKVLSRLRGRRILLPSPETAATYPYTDDDRTEIAALSHRTLTGNPKTLTKSLQTLINATGTTELMVTTPIHDHADRRHSYELIASIANDLHITPRS
jgi:luciferase family oxidoreductase group 1